jgi:ADP-ribose pyrophosphatase YjhB (NUDIX family)
MSEFAKRRVEVVVGSTDRGCRYVLLVQWDDGRECSPFTLPGCNLAADQEPILTAWPEVQEQIGVALARPTPLGCSERDGGAMMVESILTVVSGWPEASAGDGVADARWFPVEALLANREGLPEGLHRVLCHADEVWNGIELAQGVGR